MELGIEIIDLRTKQNVLDYMENYDVEVPIIEKEDDYEEDDYEESDYVPCSETGLSNKEITDILFDTKEPKYIKHTWYTDFGDTREMLLKVGAISCFKYEQCYDEPDYPYIVETTIEDVRTILFTAKNEIDNLVRLYFDTEEMNKVYNIKGDDVKCW